MSNWYIASEENQIALAHYGVKGMKWRQRKAQLNTDKVRWGMEVGSKKGANALNETNIEAVRQGHIKESYVSKDSKGNTIRKDSNGKTTSVNNRDIDGESYVTKDKYGNTVSFKSQAELDNYNKQKRKDKADSIKKKFKNIADRVKSTIKK